MNLKDRKRAFRLIFLGLSSLGLLSSMLLLSGKGGNSESLGDNASGEASRRIPIRPDLNRPESWNRSPQKPRLEANDKIPPGQLISRQRLLETLPDEKDSTVESAELKMAEQVEQEDPGSSFSSSGEISPKRQVWKVRSRHPKGIDTGRVKFSEAERTIIVDAETGQLLDVVVRGKIDPSSPRMAPELQGKTPMRAEDIPSSTEF